MRSSLAFRFAFGLSLAVGGAMLSAQSPLLPSTPKKGFGASITPAYDGWYDNADGTHTFLIGYYNRNWTQEVDIPARVSIPSKQAASSIHPCVKRSRRRRSTISARAPAGRASKKAGKLVADCINATIIGEAATEPISQAAPTFCIQVPIFDAKEAVHTLRKTE